MSAASLRLLIVEDDELLIPTLEVMVTNLGYEVSAVCMSYEEAVRAIKVNNFDLALLDIELRGSGENKDGIAVGQLLQGKKPFIYLTGLSDQNTIRQATRSHPSAYLIKPIQEPQLFSAIQLAISNYTQKKSASNSARAGEVQNFFFIRIGKKLKCVEWDAIYALVVAGNYVEVHCHDEPVRIPVRGSLRSFLESKMPLKYQKEFLRLGRSCLLHYKVIKEVREDQVMTAYGSFPTTRSKIIKRELGNF
ncbi:MAG: response regulator [Bacteroidota bacterium]